MTQYVIPANEPFKGYVQSVLKPDGTVAYTGGLSLTEYSAQQGKAFKTVSDEELDALIAEYEATLITDPAPESEEDWWYGLEVLPPCRWKTVRGVELFHISERLTGDLVRWHARIGDQHFTFTDQAGADMETLAAKVAKAATSN